MQKKTKYVSDTTSALRQVIYSQNAIGYATASEVCYQLGIRTVEINKVSPCKKTSPGTVNIDDIINGEYPITRDLYVIIRDNNTIPDTALCATNWYSSSSEKNNFGVVGWSIRGPLLTTVGLLSNYFSVKTS